MVGGGTMNSSKEGTWGVEKMWSRGGLGQTNKLAREFQK